MTWGLQNNNSVKTKEEPKKMEEQQASLNAAK